MGSDSPPEHYEETKGMSVSLNIELPEDAERIFRALSENGTVTDAAAGDVLGCPLWHARGSIRYTVDGKLRVISSNVNDGTKWCRLPVARGISCVCGSR